MVNIAFLLILKKRPEFDTVHLISTTALVRAFLCAMLLWRHTAVNTENRREQTIRKRHSAVRLPNLA